MKQGSFKSFRRALRNRVVILSAAVAGILSGASQSQAGAPIANQYWDVNGATAGSGAIGNTNTWSTTNSNWSIDPNGALATTPFISTNVAVFSAGTDATTYSANISGAALIANGIQVDDGNLTINWGNNSSIGFLGITVASTASLNMTGSSWSLGGGQTWTNNNTTTPVTVSAQPNATSIGNLILAGPGKFAFSGSGFANLTSNVTITVNTPTSLGSSLSPNEQFNVNGSSTLTVDGSSVWQSTGTMTGNVAITKIGTGDMVLNAAENANTHSGPLTINGGSVSLQANNQLSDNADIFVGATAAGANATLNLGRNNTNDQIKSLTMGGSTSTSGSIVAFAGQASVLTLGGVVTFDSTNNPLGAKFTRSGGNNNVNLNGAREFNIGDSTNALHDLDMGVPMVNGSLLKTGAGAMNLSFGNGNTYAGGTTINGGTLRANNTSNSATGAGPVVVNSGGTLGGGGSITGSLTVNSGGTVAPGNSPGNLHTGTTTWNGGSNYNWQIRDAAGAAGSATGWDLQTITGSLDLNGASSGSPININLWSLASVGPDVDGNASNFNATVPSSYLIATASTGVSGFAANKFKVHPEANNGAAGFSNAGGKWTVTNPSANNVFLNFTPGSVVYLTQSGIGSNTGQTIVASGGSGSYTSNVVDLAGDGVNAGYVTITGIPNPVTDEPILVMVDLHSNSGTPAADIAAFLSGVSAGSPSDPFTILLPGNPAFDALAGAYAGPGRTWDAVFEFNPVTDSTSQFFSWNLAADPNVTVDKLVVVPEPASVGTLAVLGAGMLGARRRRRKA